MRKNSLPDWVLQHKQKGTEVRHINGKYYLYQITSKWDVKLKRPKKKTLAYLGRITPTGFKPKKTGSAALPSSKISVRHFGAVHYFEQRSSDLLGVLEEFFPQEGQTLFVSAIFRLLYQSPLKKMSFYYQTSYASQLWTDAHLSDKTLSEYLGRIGQRRAAIVNFFGHFQKGSRFVLIDGTHLPTYSNMSGLASPGYNNHKHYKPQLNALFIFAQDEKLPLYYRLTGGDIREITSMKLAVQESQLKKVVIVSDKGFYSKSNVQSLLKEQLYFAIPLKRNNLLIDYSIIKKADKKAFAGHFFYDKRPIWYCRHRINIHGKYCWLFTFLDERLYQNEQKDYLLRVQQKRSEYTMERFYERQHRFGTLALLTYLPAGSDAQQAFEYFKTRNEVEQMIDVFKNLLKADRSYMRTEHHMEGWMFINHLALMLYYRFYKELLQLNLLSKYAPKEVLEYLERIYKLKVAGNWVTAEVPKRTRILCEKLNLPIP